MNATDQDILEQFARRVRKLEPRARIWAFGSRARGDAHQQSDFDLCVVVPERSRPLRRGIRDAAWEVGFERERVITTVILSEYDFEDGPMSASALVAAIRREGQAA